MKYIVVMMIALLMSACSVAESVSEMTEEERLIDCVESLEGIYPGEIEIKKSLQITTDDVVGAGYDSIFRKAVEKTNEYNLESLKLYCGVSSLGDISSEEFDKIYGNVGHRDMRKNPYKAIIYSLGGAELLRHSYGESRDRLDVLNEAVETIYKEAIDFRLYVLEVLEAEMFPERFAQNAEMDMD